MVTRICFILFITLFSQNTQAQQLRAFDLCDSTAYVLNPDTTIVVSKYNVYAKTESDFQLIYEFDMPFSNYYIRDFDIVNPNFWYTLIGDRTISNLTFLYKSTDRGQSWAIDTTYYMAIDNSLTNLIIDPFDPNYYNSINQVQKIGTDTVLLFLGYYGSGIVYTIDGGQHWKHWFANQPAHYFGLLECEQSYYLFQIEGDGFQGRVFPFDKQFLFRNDSLVNFDHLLSGSGHHPPFNLIDLPYVANYSNLSLCEINSFLSNYIDTTCHALTAVSPILQDQDINVYPNPNEGQFNIYISSTINTPIDLTLYNYSGQKMFSQRFFNAEELSNYRSYPALVPGGYLLVLENQKKFLSKKILVY